jgi:Ca2+-binding RTX toxin-like protein
VTAKDATDAATGVAGTPQVADPAYVVTSGGDATDSGDGVLTLREAIAEAKTADVSATITFAAGIDTVTLTQGELLVDGTSAAGGIGLTIDGGAGVRLVQGAPTGRVMHIDGDPGVDNQLVKLSSLTLEQGHVVDAVGGGLLAEGATLDLEDCLVAENKVASGSGTGTLAGGGVALLDCVTTISGGSIDQNQIEATGTAGAKGGGLYAVGGSLRLHQTGVDYNRAVVPTYGGTVRGGGIYAKLDDLEINLGSINGNSLRTPVATNAYARGGGLDLAGPGEAIISYSMIAGNTADFHGLVHYSSGGGVAIESGYVTIDHSYVGQNDASVEGGGIAASGAHLSLENSTVHRNYAFTGGGVSLRGGSAEFLGATIARNSGQTFLPDQSATGGIYAADIVPGVVNSIVAGNVGSDASTADILGTVHSNNANLFGQATVAGSGPDDLLGTDPMVGPPDFNGGPTKTLALLPGSPAAGGGVPDDARATTDQRGAGFARIVDGEIDIGAFQRQSNESVERLFTPGDDTVDLRRVDLALHPGAHGTNALAGDDTVRLSGTQNLGTRFVAGAGDDVVFGSSYHDKITGSRGDDRLGGGRGDDRLGGGRGDDRLRGGGGDDTLKGGAGADAFVFREVSDSSTGADRDMIVDFASRQGDRIVLRKIDADAALAGDQAFVWQGDDPLSGVGQLHYRHEGGDTIVEANVSGSAAPELQILLHGHLTVFAGDFLL